MNHIMLDLETLGPAPGSVIVAIGAVRFDKTGVAHDAFYERVYIQSCIEVGLTMDPDTVVWWMGQSDDARREITDTLRVNLNVALTLFEMFIKAPVGAQPALIWGCGSDFDNTLLAAAYRATRRVIPWKFWDNRCYRTLKGENPHVKMPARTGTHHNARDDARAQALHLIEIWRANDSSILAAT